MDVYMCMPLSLRPSFTLCIYIYIYIYMDCMPLSLRLSFSLWHPSLGNNA